MNASSECFFGIAFVIYFVSGVLYLGGLFGNAPHWSPLARFLARAGFVSHSLALLLHGMAIHRAPFTDLWESLSFFAWSLVLLYLVIDWRTPVPSLGAFVIPLGFLAIFFASVRAGREAPLSPLLQNHALQIHIAVSLMSYVTFAMAFCTALVYLVQENRLKRKRFDGPLSRLLPLEQADLLANRLAGVGFALLTLGLLMGLNFAAKDWTGRWWMDPKILSSFIVWLLYGGYLYARMVVGWRGRRIMLWLVVGFAAVLVGAVGINLTGASRHSFPF